MKAKIQIEWCKSPVEHLYLSNKTINMTLIKSISGIRGTIGGKVSDNLTPLDIVKFTAAYASIIKASHPNKPKVVVGRDARISGPMVQSLVNATLIGMGVTVIDLDLSTTPTVAIAVPLEKAQGGIILTASHNPKEWNALKLLNEKGEFISNEVGQEVLTLAAESQFNFSEVDDLGKHIPNTDYLNIHIQEVLNLSLVHAETIKKAKLTVVVDGVNSSGGIFIPALLEALGVQVIPLFCEPTGHFPHNPEPLEEHLTDIKQKVLETGAHLGIVVDPDVDRLAFVSEDGSMFGEEYTLVACADYVLSKTAGATVSNLSSTRALADVTAKHGQTYTASAVGEVNVVNSMKDTQAVIGGEGNGGIIYPESHYGRDALVGVALFLMHLVEKNIKASELRASYPAYFMRKDKISLTADINVDAILNNMAKRYSHEKVGTIDGVKIDFENHWVHLRKSNTEPIIRIYTEATSLDLATSVADAFMEEIMTLSKTLN